MSERVWRHRFIQALIEIIKKKTGLGWDSCFDLAFGEVDSFWAAFSQYDSPEAASLAAFEHLRTSS